MAKDLYHSIVQNALEKEGWVVTHDPLLYLNLIIKQLYHG
jgi:XisH protein